MNAFFRRVLVLLAAAVLAAGVSHAQANPPADPAQAQEPVQNPAPAEQAKSPRAKPAAKKAKGKSGSAKKAFVNFTGSFGMQVIYDDNILRMSDNTIDSFRRNDNPDKFHIETYDDLIFSPRLGLTFAKKLIGSKDTSVRFGYIRWQYYENAIKHNESWNVRFRQGTRGRDFFEASFTYAPPSYIKHLSDRPPYTPKTVPLVWLPFKIRRSAILAGYSMRVTDKLTARADVGRTWRFFNRPFLENDNWEWNGAGLLSYALTKSVKISGEYTYSDAETRSYDSTTESFDVSDDSDGSYERDMYQLSLDLSPKSWTGLWLVRQLSGVSFMGQLQKYYFTSDRPYFEDQLHVGRADDVRAFEIGVDTKPVYGPVSLTAGYRYSRRTTSLPASISAEDAEDKAYTDNRVWVGMSYPF